jgi:hypothetical protein
MPHEVKVWNKGKTWPLEVRKKISEGMQKYWQEMDDEQKEKIHNQLRKNSVESTENRNEGLRRYWKHKHKHRQQD